jgi:hypothetical protein
VTDTLPAAKENVLFIKCEIPGIGIVLRCQRCAVVSHRANLCRISLHGSQGRLKLSNLMESGTGMDLFRGLFSGATIPIFSGATIPNYQIRKNIKYCIP